MCTLCRSEESIIRRSEPFAHLHNHMKKGPCFSLQHTSTCAELASWIYHPCPMSAVIKNNLDEEVVIQVRDTQETVLLAPGESTPLLKLQNLEKLKKKSRRIQSHCIELDGDVQISMKKRSSCSYFHSKSDSLHAKIFPGMYQLCRSNGELELIADDSKPSPLPQGFVVRHIACIYIFISFAFLSCNYAKS